VTPISTNGNVLSQSHTYKSNLHPNPSHSISSLSLMELQQSNLETPLKIQHDHRKITTSNPESSPPRPFPESSRKHDSPPPRASTNEPMKKIGTPDRLRVPIAFKYPERYRSPTDAMMSPVTKGLLARTRKSSGSLIPPSFNQTKVNFFIYQNQNRFYIHFTNILTNCFRFKNYANRNRVYHLSVAEK